MQKEFFDRFFVKVRHIDIHSCTTERLIILYKVYSNVFSLISVYTDLGDNYGGRSAIRQQARSVAEILVSRIEKGMTGELEMTCLESLFDYSSQYMDERWDDLALERSSHLIKKYTGDKAGGREPQMSPDTEASLCNLIGICFYLVGEAELAKAAEGMITGWGNRQARSGEWPGLPVTVSIKRFYAIEAYQSYTLDLSFGLLLKKGLGFYLSNIRLPQGNEGPDEEQVQELIGAADLLLFVKKRQHRQEQLKQTGALIEQYLKKIDEACGKGNMTPCSEFFSELSLNCMRVLAAWLMECMRCNPGENKNREKSVTE